MLENIILIVPKWNIELEKRNRELYFYPFIRALCNIDEKELFDWISKSFDFFTGRNITSKHMVNKMKIDFIKDCDKTLRKTGGKINFRDLEKLSIK